MLFSGRQDTVVLLKESEAIYGSLRTAGTRTELRCVVCPLGCSLANESCASNSIVNGEHSLRLLENTPEYQQSEQFPQLREEMMVWISRCLL